MALAAAVVITLVYGFGEDHPVTEETKVSLICSECEHVFKMTNKLFNEHSRNEPRPWPPAPCPKCGKKTAFLAGICGKCGLTFLRDTLGEVFACPRCYPDVEPPEEEYYEEEVDGERRRIPIRAI